MIFLSCMLRCSNGFPLQLQFMKWPNELHWLSWFNFCLFVLVVTSQEHHKALVKPLKSLSSFSWLPYLKQDIVENSRQLSLLWIVCLFLCIAPRGLKNMEQLELGPVLGEADGISSNSNCQPKGFNLVWDFKLLGDLIKIICPYGVLVNAMDKNGDQLKHNKTWLRTRCCILSSAFLGAPRKIQLLSEEHNPFHTSRPLAWITSGTWINI